MSYQVIARKWRPQTFADVVGQVHITQTLGNALANGRIHHAILFTGPRGTGKTSSARILAKSLRCPNAQSFVPCGTCSSCLEIAAGRSLDVQELDAASNNSVDDIRKLLDGVMSAPSSGKWKIYIVDEVHMLSSSAFNALLKTLEEPPAHVVFILATTEVHKIPETILSRCQRFDFRRIPTRQITDHLRVICQGEGMKADEDALWLIARQGDGSMRDAQSLLDQVITFANGPLTAESVARILGLTDRSLLLDCMNQLLARDTQGMLKVIEKLTQSGLEPRLFAQEMLESLRHLLIVKVSSSQLNSILDLPDSEMKFFAEMSSHMSEEDIHFLFDMALKGVQDLLRAHDPRLVLEVLLLRMAGAPRIVDLQSLLANPMPMAHTSQPRGELRPSPGIPKVEIPAETKPEKVAPPPPAKAAGKTPADRWLHFVTLVRAQDPIFAAKMESLLFVSEEGTNLRLAIPAKMVFLRDQLADAEVRKKLKGFIDSHWAEGYSFEIVMARETQASAPSAQSMAAEKQREADDAVRHQISDHPMVKAAQSVFGGQIKSITTVKEGARK